MITHEYLYKICRDKYWYENGLDTNNHNNPDCSCGCKWFIELEGKFGMDWGVCCNKNSPRKALLTFEHMGCKYFENEKRI